MPSPGEHKTVQARVLQYAQEIGWTFVPRRQAEDRRGFDRELGSPAEQAAAASLYFDDLVYQKVREFNPQYSEAEGALVGVLRRLTANIFGNSDLLGYLRNTGKFYSREEDRELDLVLKNLASLGMAQKSNLTSGHQILTMTKATQHDRAHSCLPVVLRRSLKIEPLPTRNKQRIAHQRHG